MNYFTLRLTLTQITALRQAVAQIQAGEMAEDNGWDYSNTAYLRNAVKAIDRQFPGLSYATVAKAG